MRILFLAIDGVLNNTDFVSRIDLSSDGGFVSEDDIVEFKRRTLEPAAVAFVNSIIDAHPDVQIVVLSTWHPLAPELVERTLRAAGLCGTIHGHTRRVGQHDGAEAAAYVLTHKIDDYVILTDCTDLGYQITKAVITQSTVGMRKKHAQDVIRRFDTSTVQLNMPEGWDGNTPAGPWEGY